MNNSVKDDPGALSVLTTVSHRRLPHPAAFATTVSLQAAGPAPCDPGESPACPSRHSADEGGVTSQRARCPVSTLKLSPAVPTPFR